MIINRIRNGEIISTKRAPHYTDIIGLIQREDIPAIKIDAVNRLAFSSDLLVDKIPAEVIPNAAPLYDLVMYECKGTDGSMPWAVFIVYNDRTSDDLLRIKQYAQQQGMEDAFTHFAKENVRWIAGCYLFAYCDKKVFPIGRSIWGIHPDGTLVPGHITIPISDEVGRHDVEHHIYEKEKRYLYSLPAIAHLATSFAHCKNVSIQAAEPISEKLQKARKRRGKTPLVRSYTLMIGGMRRVLKREGEAQTQGMTRALHKCRGHFATYTKDKPLFGKYVGQVYVPGHWRGQDTHTLIKKDYQIEVV